MFVYQKVIDLYTKQILMYESLYRGNEFPSIFFVNNVNTSVDFTVFSQSVLNSKVFHKDTMDDVYKVSINIYPETLRRFAPDILQIIDINPHIYPELKLDGNKLDIYPEFYAFQGRIILDDFSFNNLMHLKMLEELRPFAVKIDVLNNLFKFVSKMEVEMGNNKSYFIAKKVETESILKGCLAKGFRFGQGFLFDN